MPVFRPAGRLIALVTAVFASASAALAAPPTLLTAVSRITQGATPYDIQLPLAGGSGIECRTITNGLSLVLTFDQPIASLAATVTAGTATVGTPKYSTNTVTIPVAGLIDAEAVTVNLANVTNAAVAPEVLASQDVSLRTLFGDVNGSGTLSGSDVSTVRAAVADAKPVSGATFRCDLNLSGTFSGSDVSSVRAAVANAAFIDGGPTANAAPTLTSLAAQTVTTGQPMSPLGFTVADAESDPSTLTVTWTTSDPYTIPSENITVSGTGGSRQITLTPAAGVTTTVPVDVTLYVSDGLAYSDPMTFTVRVTPPPIAYLATLAPMEGTGSLGTGTAVLTVSGDRTYATISTTSSNLSSGLVDDTVNDGSGAVMYDLPVGRVRGDLQTDGSLKWTFNVTKAPDILAALASNSAYYIIDTASNPAGELTGIFKPLTGSQTFTPPAAPPAFTLSPPTPADASRFLQQAQFGGTSSEIAALSNTSAANASTAIEDWFAAQFATPLPIYPTYAASSIPPAYPLDVQSASQPYSPSSMYAWMYYRLVVPQAVGYAESLSADRVHEGWMKNAVTAPDGLRQRVATALSEIFVVSENNGTIGGSPLGLASYYDMLAGDAFGNFRQLLSDVTLHPIMGVYLDMKGNKKTAPNENYAREIMQLFTIGLYMLQPDGTLMLDAKGQPIPTYSQAQITSLAQVYTGWDQNTAGKVIIPTFPAPTAPATQPTVVNFTSYYQQPMIVTASNHSTNAKTLLTYPGVGQTTIAANTKQTADAATAELNVTLDNIFNHPNVGPFICRQLIQRLVESNPSPAYVYRVAQVFNNDGTGVRGNMGAVVKAILTDYEARSTAVRGNAGYGKPREPIVRLASFLHSMNAFSKTNHWAIGRTDTQLQQTIFRAPTVFNFFDPGYSQPGPVQQAGLASPEFSIIYETTITNSQNMLYTGIYSAANADGSNKLTGVGFKGDSYGYDIFADFSTAGNGLVALTQQSGTSAMLGQVELLIAGAPMDASGTARARIQTFLNTLPNTNPLAQVQAAAYLVATAPQTAVQK